MNNFLIAFTEAQMVDYATQGAYLDYETLISTLYDTLRDTTCLNEFDSCLRTNLNRVGNWVESKNQEITLQSSKLLIQVKHHENVEPGYQAVAQESGPILGYSHTTQEVIDSFFVLALSVTHEFLRFCEAVNLNEDALQNLSKQCIDSSSCKCYKAIVDRNATALQVNVDSIVTQINAIFTSLRKILRAYTDWIQGRQTSLSPTTYSVKLPPGAEGTQTFERRSIKFWVHPQDLPYILSEVSQHLPIHTPKSKITSVYFDTPDLTLYHERMHRTEGSFLIRIRWYADKRKNVFIERKVHHDSWIGEASTKQRFSISESLVNTFLRGKWDLEAEVETLKKRGAQPQEVDNFMSLVQDVLTKVHDYSLQPILRSEYERVAFQFPDTAAVRVSCDTNVTLSKELAKEGNWRRNDDVRELRDSEVVHFPYAIVEVKLQISQGQEAPDWIIRLMSHSMQMESVPKFSKYAHGICSLFSQRCRLEPYWLHQVQNDIRSCIKDEDGYNARDGLYNCCSATLDRCIFGELRRESQIWTYTPEDSHVLTQKYFHTLLSDHKYRIPTLCNISARHHSYARNGIAHHSRVHSQCPCWACDDSFVDQNSKIYTMDPRFRHALWQSGKCIRVPKKLDPKTVITTERYLLRWLSMGSSTAFAGIVLLLFSERIEGTRGYYVHAIGIASMVGSILMCIYSLIVYRLRVVRILARTVSRYDDPWGPYSLTGIWIIVIFTLAFIPLYDFLGTGYAITPITEGD